uniref:Tetratricopeptide repeat domain 37 n=1 Tax=Pygocentrus nattereri TaxID=42514 RepID=A0AAR2JYH8_PYGNA
MSNKEVKSALKSAREAIKNKEFKEALKHCKAVLKLEKNNYNAWVFIGVAAGELEQPDQAQTAYKKAAELEPDQLLAWQGLANLYEKSNQEDFKAELPKIYQKLITLYETSDKVRCFEVSKKLVDIYQADKNYLQVARVWRRLIQMREAEEGVENFELLELWREMTRLLLSTVEKQDNETQQHLLSAFEQALQLTAHVPSEDHMELTKDYIKCLSKLPHEVVKLKEMCETMLSLYPKDSYPLEVLGEYYLISGVVEDAVSCYTRLLELDPASSLAHFGLGVKALKDKKYEDAVKSLGLGLRRMRFSIIGWYNLAQAELKMHKYADSALSSSQGTICLSLPDLWLTKVCICTCVCVFARVHFTFMSLIYSFVEALSQRSDSGELYLLLGKLYWSMGEETRRDRSKAHTHLLKAAKLDPHLGSVFRYLGHYYREVAKDLGRARGCYKRAFELDSTDGEAGAATVDLCMEQGDMGSALEILQSVTERATPGSAKWAWMRRGLYYLKVGQHPQAIADLQAALRADPQDWVCWECLGEAYLNRHSFTAALKAFAKAHLLQPSSIYSLYQTAAIKQILGRFKEAAGEYLHIIEREEYVPALKGLGECLLALAKTAMEDYLDGKAVDLIQEAIKYLFRAVQKRSDLSCLWKLLGNACTSCSTVSPNRASALVPGALCGAEPADQNHMLDQKQLLTLGERCYGRALKLMAETPSIWCDLGLNYYHQSRLLLSQSTEQDIQPLLEKALQCVKKAVMLDSGNHTYWNALGVVAMAKGIENFALAQHSFIKSVKVESNNVVAWTNLGTLYLKKGNIELAHEAFKIAQSLEPLYVNCWIGQALIAETVGSYDTMDLFRHTTELILVFLNMHLTEGVKGYAYWVCSTLLDKSNRDSELYRYNIVQMNAVSAAQVALSKYTERIQTDTDAFVMLGFLNEHLQLKKQATEAYKSLFFLLLHIEPLTDFKAKLCFDCSDTSRWEEAVHYYSSTPLEELHDLAGLALACFRAGRLQESVNAYEKALAVASTEKEKACILTALALLQHRLGNMDTAKTLLFKCSLLKEPVPESLVCLCALGLVHGDVTLASAALLELLKMEETIGGAVEERCLLTCTLLSLQGNYTSVQREASRAVFRNPGNPSLWALLSRLVPQYCPSKADVSIPEALLYSGVNQLASGRHLNEDRRRNALKTIQRAVLLCPGECVCVGVLTVFCTVCSRAVKGLQREDGLLAQALENWTLQQTVTGLKQSGQYDEAETLCSQHPAVFLLLRQVQCERFLLSGGGKNIPTAVLDQLSSAIMANPTSVSAWHWLAEVYRSQGLLAQASVALKQSLQLASQLGHHSGKIGSLLRLALLALAPCMAGVGGNEWKDLVRDACTEVLKLGPFPLALLFQALLQYSIKMGARETRRLLEKIVYGPCSGEAKTVALVARWYLLRHLHAKDDLQLIDTLMVEAAATGDSRLLEFHKRLYP